LDSKLLASCRKQHRRRPPRRIAAVEVLNQSDASRRVAA
jgi:hypothetical protein